MSRLEQLNHEELTWAEAVELAIRAGRLFAVKQRVFKSDTDGWTWVDAKPGTSLKIRLTEEALGRSEVDRHIRISLDRAFKAYGPSPRWFV